MKPKQERPPDVSGCLEKENRRLDGEEADK